MLCKVKITVTAKADNAIQVSRSSYALVLGKHIYLTEKDFCPPRTALFITTLITMGIIYTIRHDDARITLRLF